MKLFIDTANLQKIEEALKRGFVRGITTNPSLLAKEPKGSFEKHIGRIIELIGKYKAWGISLSVEVFSRNPDEIFAQAQRFRQDFKYEALSVKVQVGWDELEVIRRLHEAKISVNCTCCMSVTQATMAAAAGATYVSLFWARIRDFGTPISDNPEKEEKRSQALSRGLQEKVFDHDDLNPFHVVRKTREFLDKSYPGVEIIAGSIRSVTDIVDAGLAGAHIVTISPKFFPDMIKHFKTDEVVEQFLKDFQSWLQ